MVSVNNTRNTNNTYYDNVQQTVPGVKNSVPIISREQSEAPAETTHAQNTEHQCEKTREIDNALIPVFRKYGVDYNQIKREGANILNEIGIKFHHKKHEPISAEKLQELVNYVEKLLAELKASNQEINAKNLLTAHQKHLDLFMLNKKGISEEDWQKMLESGEAKGIRELLGLKEGEELTAEKIEAYIQKKNEEFKAKLESITDPEEKSKFIKESIEKQMKAFAICIAATDGKDRKILFNAVKDMFANNREEAVKMLFECMTEEDRKTLAESIDDKKLKAILLNKDILGNSVSKEDGTAIVAGVTSYQSEQRISENHSDMTKEAREFFAREDVKALLEKIKNGEELTEEEKELKREYDFYITLQSGEQIGTANHAYLEDDTIKNLLKTMNYDAYSLPTYKEVMEEISSYIENNPDSLRLSKEEFTKLMDEVTEGNYSTIVEGTGAELKAPTKPEAPVEKPSANADFGYKNTTVENINLSQPEILKNELYAQKNTAEEVVIVKEEEKTSKKKKSSTPIITTVKEFNEYAKENGYIAAITDVFSKCTNYAPVLTKTVKIFKRFNPATQVLTLKRMNNKGLTVLLPKTHKDALKQLKGTTFTNYYATKQVEEAVEKMEEKA